MVGLTGGELQHGLRAPRSGRPPGPEGGHHLHDPAVTRKEDDVDRKAHEEGVNRGRRPEQQPFPTLQSAPSEQPAHPRQRRLGNEASLADDLALGRPKRNGPHQPFFAPNVKSPATNEAADQRAFQTSSKG